MRRPIKKAPSPELGEKASQPERGDEPAMMNVVRGGIEGALYAMGCSDLEVAGMAFAIASGSATAIVAVAHIAAARHSADLLKIEIEGGAAVGDSGSVDFF